MLFEITEDLKLFPRQSALYDSSPDQFPSDALFRMSIRLQMAEESSLTYPNCHPPSGPGLAQKPLDTAGSISRDPENKGTSFQEQINKTEEEMNDMWSQI